MAVHGKLKAVDPKIVEIMWFYIHGKFEVYVTVHYVKFIVKQVRVSKHCRNFVSEIVISNLDWHISDSNRGLTGIFSPSDPPGWSKIMPLPAVDMCLQLFTWLLFLVGWDNAVGIVNRYRLDGSGTEFRGGGGGKLLGTPPARLWAQPSLLHNGYRFSFPGVKRPGRGVNHPPSSSAEVKERVEL